VRAVVAARLGVPAGAAVSLTLLEGDCRAVLPTLPAESVQCVVTSPPYWGLRDYGVAGQLGLEPTSEEYLATMVGVFREVRRVLRADGTCWVNMGDGYNANQGAGFDTHGDGGLRKALAASPKLARPAGLKPKDLIGMPWRLALALQADGWFLRADIIWAKPNPMPESVTDRPTKAHEYVFLLTKSARYFYDADAVREPASSLTSGNVARVVANGGVGRRPADHLASHVPWSNDGTGRNLRSVWTIPTAPYPEAHFATFPPDLARRCIVAGSSAKGCCGECGAPWARDTERTSILDPRPPTTRAAIKAALGDMARTTPQGRTCGSVAVTTLGWRPTCAHDAAPVPCTVLDPFAGSGTVGEVAEQNGRDAVLIELSPAYVALARARTAQRGLFTSPDACGAL